ncbi:MAG TPA: acetyltransferase [Candidatus Moranbacteria bacterium]|nr:acetyltransferase [Candidatus Moranbacteria bacterium]
MKHIVIIGAGGFARGVAWLIEEINSIKRQWQIIGYVDDDSNKHGQILNNYHVIGGLKELHRLSRDIYLICAIGDPYVRQTIVKKVAPLGFLFANIVHPSVKRSPYISMGCGNIIGVSSIMTVNITIGNHNIINHNCTIAHDVFIGNYCNIFSAANLSGNVVLHDLVSIGTNAAIVQGISIGEGTIIGAGSVVVRHLPPNCTAVGVPARPIKFHQELGDSQK